MNARPYPPPARIPENFAAGPLRGRTDHAIYHNRKFIGRVCAWRLRRNPGWLAVSKTGHVVGAFQGYFEAKQALVARYAK
jgi:hypothetical protein